MTVNQQDVLSNMNLLSYKGGPIQTRRRRSIAGSPMISSQSALMPKWFSDDALEAGASRAVIQRDTVTL
jgi:hypothetical protein